MTQPADSLACLFSGNFHRPDAESCVYVAKLKRHRGIHKVGISQLPFREWRWGDEEYGKVYKQVKGTRLECWLVEQRILLKTLNARCCPDRLKLRRWPGYTELRSLAGVGGGQKLAHLAEGIMVNLRAKGIHAFVDEYLPSEKRWADLRKQWLEAA